MTDIPLKTGLEPIFETNNLLVEEWTHLQTLKKNTMSVFEKDSVGENKMKHASGSSSDRSTKQ